MAKVKLQPLGRRVLVKPLEESEDSKTEAGLIIPDTADKEKPTRGTVIETGKVHKDDPSFLMKAGDEVFFKEYAPNKITLDGEDMFLIDEDDILAILN